MVPSITASVSAAAASHPSADFCSLPSDCWLRLLTEACQATMAARQLLQAEGAGGGAAMLEVAAAGNRGGKGHRSMPSSSSLPIGIQGKNNIPSLRTRCGVVSLGMKRAMPLGMKHAMPLGMKHVMPSATCPYLKTCSRAGLPPIPPCSHTFTCPPYPLAGSALSDLGLASPAGGLAAPSSLPFPSAAGSSPAGVATHLLAVVEQQDRELQQLLRKVR